MGSRPVPCPHCGRPTDASRVNCDSCGRALPAPTVLTSAPDAATGAVDFTGATFFPPPPAATATSAFTGDLTPSAGNVFAPGFKIGTRYTVIKLLGRGGMGAVYQAWDDELMVAVAIKVILADAGSDPGTRHDAEQRFKRELILARQVTHKNVVRIHDLGEVDGTKYITMSFLEGETLGAMLRRERTLPVTTVVALGRQLAQGLVAAHEVGVIHRDLKPENIMVTPDGQAVIMDFGIARSSSPGQTQTQAGSVMGTLEYMAPEQAAGKPLDQRVDVYALGLILYDLLVGRSRVVRRDSAMTEMMERMQRPPETPRAHRPDLPDGLESLVVRCLEVDPAARFATSAELSAALDALTPDGHARATAALPVVAAKFPWLPWAAAAAVLAVVVAAVLWRGGLNAPPPPNEPVSVLIANFENKTGDAVFDGVVEQALGLGIESASFVTAYPRRDALRVAATIKPGSTLDEATARLVARREGIKVVLTGAVEADGGAYKISTRAVGPGEEGATLYALEVNADGKASVLEAVGSLAGMVREALGDTEVPKGGPAANETFTAASLEAARAYAQAQEHQFAGRRDQAIASYEEAVRLDPDFGRAYSGLATQHNNAGRTAEAARYYGEANKRLHRMTDREKLRTQGLYYLFARQPQQAFEQLTALIKAYPGDDTGLQNIAVARTYLRDFAGALVDGRKAAALQPTNAVRRSNVALYAMYAGQFEAAITESDEALKLNPTAVRPLIARACSELALGRVADAEATYRRLSAFPATGPSFAALGLADVALFAGRTGDAIALLENGIAADVAQNNVVNAARKRLALADAYLARRDKIGAAREAQAALQLHTTDATRVAAGFIFVRAGRKAEAETVLGQLAGSLESDPQAYAELIRAELALTEGQIRVAVERARDANKKADTWLGHVILGRAYLAASSYVDANTEFETALKRKGEATALFLDEMPTYRLVAPVLYHLAIAQAGVGSAAAPETFKQFLAIKQNGDETDGLVADARRRLSTAQ